MIGEQQIVIVQKAEVRAARHIQPGVGGGAALQRPALIHEAQRKRPALFAQGEVAGAMGVDHDHFERGIGLLGDAGQRFGQRGPRHAADDEADGRWHHPTTRSGVPLRKP